MECSRMALALVALMLAAAPVDQVQALAYPVGDIISENPNWFPHNDTSYYQNWVKQLTLYINDTLWFRFDRDTHDVTTFRTSSDLTSCSIDIANRTAYYKGPDLALVLTSPGPWYIMSSGQTSTNTSSDCLQGMQFFFTVLQSRDSSPPPSIQGPQVNLTIEWGRQPADANHYTNLFGGPWPIGSVISFDFKESEHSIVRVKQSDFDACKVPSKPLGIYNIPNTPLVLGEDTVYYYIDGIGDNCDVGNMKLRVQVGQGSSNQGGKGKTFPVTAVAVPTVVISILVLGLVGFRHYRRKHGSKPRSRYSDLKGSAARLTTGTIFTYAELDRATNSFSADNEVGRGGFGTVYKGTLRAGRTVAIKRAKHANDVESFLNEVAILSQVNNRNLVKLLGCCIEVENPLLVYEFVPNGTLQDHLSIAANGFRTGLDWNTRFRIALQTAEALKYLHVQATPPIFHRDVKSANILLDHNFNGKVADFGLSKLVELEFATHVSTLVKGTPGYLDPEYFRNCHLTDKSDVYGFGVVLLELITSKKPMDCSRPDGEQNLALSSIPLIKSGRVHEIIDSYMLSTLSPEKFQAVKAVAQVAVACVGSSRASRPSMSEVVEMLQRIKGSKLKAEEFYSKADVINREDRMIEVQDYGILLGDSGSTTRGTSSSDSGNVTQPMILR